MHTSKSSLLTLTLGLMLAAGCSKTASDTTPPEPAMTEPAPPPVVVTTEPEPTPEPAPAVEQTPPAPAPLTDGEIVEIIKVANDGEIEDAKIAKTKAKDKRVKAFAAMMAKDHAAANKREAALAKRANIMAIDNEVARKLMDEAKVRTEALKSAAKGAEFDRVYMDNQVQAHTLVLDLINNHMLPAAHNSELKAELEAMRGSVEAHLTHAKEIKESLAHPSA